jgi:class 3 adenylate cyclase
MTAAPLLDFDVEDPTPGAPAGQTRRLTMLFIDLVGSTALSCRVEPETYRTVVAAFRRLTAEAATDLGGHVCFVKGDGLLVRFGHPVTRGDDTQRAVAMGLFVTEAVARLSAQVERRFGFPIAARVGVHRGLVYLDTAQDDVYGGEVGLTTAIAGHADPGTVVVSDAVAALVASEFELQPGVPGCQRVVGERCRHTADRRHPLVGRTTELAYLEQCWAQAQAHRLTVPGVMFRGAPGIGKSRLAAEAERLAQNSGKPVLRLHGCALRGPMLVRPARHLPDATTVSDDPEILGDRPLELFGDDAGVLIAEDVHWFDPATWRVLDTVLSRSRGRVLVVITGRTGLSLPADSPVRVIDLHPMTDAEADQLARALAPTTPESVRLAARERGDGVPLYIEQILAEPDTGVPDRLYDALLAQIDVSGRALLVLQAAAVIGRRVDSGRLRAALDLSDIEFDEAIDEIESRALLVTCGQGWRFRHELVRAMAVELAPPSTRRYLRTRLENYGRAVA